MNSAPMAFLHPPTGVDDRGGPRPLRHVAKEEENGGEGPFRTGCSWMMVPRRGISSMRT